MVEPASLAGVRCRRCVASFFPAVGRCPRCGGTGVETVDLGGEGVVEAVTRIGDEGVAEVRLDSGVLVMGAVDAELVIGARVRYETPDQVMRFVGV
ncbi:MAG TPA: hypothetical protein VE990_05770 [Acidimicrobiales bacterium]|nr:hypothetical protein [Acidimicrobiales bacterium]